MDYDEEVVVQPKHDPLPEPPQAVDGMTDDFSDRRIEAADDEGIANPNALNPLTDYARSQRMQIQLDIGELGHTRDVPRRPLTCNGRTRIGRV
jgi:hypothetical protein